MSSHVIKISNTSFEHEITSAQSGDSITFELEDGRTASAPVSWQTGLFVSKTPNPLEVTPSSSPTARIEASSGTFTITTTPQEVPIKGTIRVGSSTSST